MASSSLSLILAFLFLSSIHGIRSITFTFKNNCQYTVWPAALTASGSAQLHPTGFQLPAGNTFTLHAPPNWSGRFWARTHCKGSGPGPTDRFTCLTGDCGSGQLECGGAGGAPPVTLVELTLNGADKKDFYDISLVDGFNIPVALAAVDRRCTATSCPRDVNRACPPELAIRGSGGAVVACKSACLAYGTSEYCCTGNHSSVTTCPPMRYSEMFKRECPQAYSYAFDDKTSTFTCPSGSDYVVTFCP